MHPARRLHARRRAARARGPAAAGRAARHRRVARAVQRLAAPVPAQVPEAGRPARAARARPARRAHRGPRRSSPPTSASTRCGPRSSAARTTNRHWITSRRRRHDGLRLPGRDRRAVRAARGGGLGRRRRRRLPDDAVRAGHRGASTSCPSRSSSSTTTTSAWCASGRSCSSTTASRGVDLEGNPDFVKLAEAYGIKGLRIRRPGDIDRKLKEALAYNDGPVRGRGRGREGGQRLPDDPGRRADRGHDHRAARSTSWRSPVAAPESSTMGVPARRRSAATSTPSRSS